jgi:hypothetical protein
MRHRVPLLLVWCTHVSSIMVRPIITTINKFSGCMNHIDDVINIEMSIFEAMQLIVTFGVVE